MTTLHVLSSLPGLPNASDDVNADRHQHYPAEPRLCAMCAVCISAAAQFVPLRSRQRLVQTAQCAASPSKLWSQPFLSEPNWSHVKGCIAQGFCLSILIRFELEQVILQLSGCPCVSRATAAQLTSKEFSNPAICDQNGKMFENGLKLQGPMAQPCPPFTRGALRISCTL